MRCDCMCCFNLPWAPVSLTAAAWNVGMPVGSLTFSVPSLAVL